MQIMHFILDLLHTFLSLVVAKLCDLKNSPVFWPTLYMSWWILYAKLKKDHGCLYTVLVVVCNFSRIVLIINIFFRQWIFYWLWGHCRIYCISCLDVSVFQFYNFCFCSVMRDWQVEQGVRFLTCLCLFVRSVTKRVSTVFSKRMNWFWSQWANVIHASMTWNSKLWGSRGRGCWRQKIDLKGWQKWFF